VLSRVPVDDRVTTCWPIEWSCAMSTFLWISLATLYLVALFALGLTTLRKRHLWLFGFGIVFPILWVVGALIGPAPRASGTVSPL